VPEGSIVGQADIKLSPRTEAQIPPTLPRDGDMSPDKVPFGGGVRIQAQGQFRQTKELHVEIPVPPGVQVVEGQRVAMLRPSKYTTPDGVQHDVWETVTSATVEGGKYKSTSPPFIGLWLVPDFYEIEVFIPKSFYAVYGTVKEQVVGGAPKPLAGVTVKILQGAGNPNNVPAIVTHTSDNGGFGTFDFATSIGTEHVVYAEDTLGRSVTAVAAPDLKTNPWLFPGMFGITGYYAAVEFPPADASGPESKPAVLRMYGQRTDLDPGQRDSLAEDGLVSVGTQVAVAVEIFPQVATFSGKLMANGVEVQTLVWQRESGGANNPEGEQRVTTFRVPSQGSFSVVVETLTKANAPATKAKAAYNFVGLINPNVRPPLPGPPKVLSVTPPDKARQVDAGRRLRFEFSEPVKNLVPGETVYVRQAGSDKKQGGRLLSGGVPIGTNSENISQLDFEPEGGLAGGKEYEVHVTSEVADTDGHKLDQEQTSEDDQSPQPFESTFTTFAGLVLTDAPVENNGHRIAAAGQYAITVDGARGSHMKVYDMSNPSKPEAVGTAFVPDWAVGLAMVEVPEGGETFKVGVTKQEYSRIAVVGSVPIPADYERTTNLWIYSLEDPSKPEMIGVVSLSFGSNLTAIPANLTILGKRAYVGATPQGGTYAVDIEQAINQWAEQVRLTGPVVAGNHPMVTAIRPHGGFAKDAKRQTVTYADERSLSNQGSAPTNAISSINQVTVAPSAGGIREVPVSYVTTPNKPYLATLGFQESDDSRNGFWDEDNDGRDDRVLELWELEPAGLTRDVKALSGVPIKGRTMDVAVVLGNTRLWIFDATNPRDLKQYTSRTFEDLGIDDLGYAMRMDVEGSLAYVIFQNHIAVVDFSDPEHPARVATIESAGVGMKAVAVKDGFVYTLSDSGLNVSIARPASQVIVHGLNPGDDRICTNPVVLSRDNRMTQAAGVYFQVFGSDMPKTAQVVIRRERTAGEQHSEETLATLPANIDATLSSAKVIVGRATWNSQAVIDRTWTYTAEVVFDDDTDTEFHARREPVPFSYLIAEAMNAFGSSGGKGFYNYVLGGEASVTLTVEGRNILDDAADPHARTYGLNADLVRHELKDGVYPFKLRAVLESDPSVADEVEGEMTVANTPSDLRLPGNTVVSDVELQTGNLAVSYNDIHVQGRGAPLSLSRSYNGAGSNSFGPFGYGWSHNLQVLLVHDRLGKSYTMRGGDGGGQLFKEANESGGKIEAEDPHVGTIVKNPDGSIDYFTRAHVKYHFPGAMEEDDTNYFNLSYMGNLQYMEDPNGNRTTLTYDTQGRMTKAADSSNRTLEFTYEQANTPLVGVIAPSAGAISCTNKGQFGLVRARFLRSDVGKAWRITGVKGPGGLKITYEYDDDGNLARAERSGEDSLSAPSADLVWQYEYNPPSNDGKQHTHLIKSVTAPNDGPAGRRVTTYEYHFDQFRNPVKSIRFPGDVSNTFEYTFASNQVTKTVVRDGRGNPTTYAFDRGAHTVTATHPRGATTVTVYDKKGQPSSVTDPLGAVTKTTYERGNPTSVTVTGGGGASATTATRYDATFNKPVSVTDTNGNTTTYSLDQRGNVTQVTLPTGGVIRNTFFPNGDVQSMTDQYGSTTTYAYDQWGNRTRTERGGVISSRTFDVRGRQTSSSGTLEPTVQNTYDALDHRIKAVTTDTAGIRDAATSTRTYLPEGQMLTATDTSGGQRVAVTNTYDAQDRVTKTVEDVSGAGSFTRDYTYDANSNLLTETDRRGVKSEHVYDELNFRTKTTASGPFGASKTVSDAEVNLVGLPVTMRDVYGQTVSLEYDGMRRLKKRTLPGGYSEELTYDGAGNVTSSKDLNGRTTSTSYDGLNRPVERRDAAGRTTTWVYDDSSHAVTEQHDPQGLTLTTRRDAEGRIVSSEVKFSGGDYTTSYDYQGLTVRITDPRGVVTTKQLSAMGDEGDVSVAGADPAYSTSARYDGFGGVKSRTDAMGRAASVTLDGFGRPLQVGLPGGVSESFAYDGEGNTLSHTDRRGVKTETTYDNLDRPLSTKVSGLGGSFDVNTIDYGDSASTETHTDARGKQTVFKYDGQHRLVSVTGADNSTRTMEYDGVNLLREGDGKSQYTSYSYDGANRVTQVTDRAGQVTSVSHSDGGGYTKSVTDRRGVQTAESYDGLGRLKSITRAGELLFAFEYDEGSNVKARTDGRNNRTAYSYDALGRVRTIDHASTQTETFKYDAAGNVLEYSDGAGGAVTSTYDELGHLRTRRNGAGDTTTFKYDGEGLLIERADPKGAGSRTAYEYNALGSLVKVTDPAGVWELGYDPAQNLTAVKDAAGRTVSYEYDPVGRVTDVHQPLGLTSHVGYDANGNVTSRTDAKGQQTTISYDALDRPRTVSYAGAAAAGPSKLDYSYDAEGHVTDVSETLPAGVRRHARTYDPHGRLQTSTDPFGHKVSFAYDAADNLRTLTDAANRQTSYDYDAANRLKSVALPGGGQVGYTWRADGLVSAVDYGAGMRRDYTYDGADRLTNVVNTLGAAQTEEYAYTYDANSNRATETRKFNGSVFRSLSYGYDGLDRLKRVESSVPGRPGLYALDYEYDAAGNRKSQAGRDSTGAQADHSYAYDDLNRLKTVTGYAGGDVEYGYDDNGNLTSKTQGGQTTAYEYDVRDQLRRVLAGGSEVASYDYDADKRRIGRKVAGAGALTYVYAGGNVIGEFDEANRLVNRYDYGADVLRGELAGEGARYYFSDGQGSVTALAAAGGQSPAARYEYDAWGERVATGASANLVGYTGQRLDPETGLVAAGAGERYYAPGLGRFIQQDAWTGTAQMAQSLNRYAYAYANPLRYTDPSGNKPVEAPGGRAYNILQYRQQFTNIGRDGNGQVQAGAYALTFRKNAAGEPEMVQQARETAGTYQELQAQAAAPRPGDYVGGPKNYLRDPSDNYIVNGLSNTLSDVLGLDFVAESAWVVGDHRRPMSERIFAGAALVGHTALAAFGGPIMKGAGKLASPLLRRVGASVVGRMASAGVNRLAETGLAKATGRLLARALEVGNKPIGQLLRGRASSAAEGLAVREAETLAAREVESVALTEVEGAVSGEALARVEGQLATHGDDLARLAGEGEAGWGSQMQAMREGGGVFNMADDAAMSGPVYVKPPPNATAAQINQVKAYVAGANKALEEGALSSTGRVSTKGALRSQASRAARKEAKAAAAAGKPYSGHAGHVPDTTWTGTPEPHSWLDLDPTVNTSIGGQSNGYPIGYKPTRFIFKME
jgi:RHS repeat-associated protein